MTLEPETATSIAELFIPQEGLLSFESLHRALRDFQSEFGAKGTKKERRAARESPQQKTLREELRKMKSPETIALEDDIPELKPLHETKRQVTAGETERYSCLNGERAQG